MTWIDYLLLIGFALLVRKWWRDDDRGFRESRARRTWEDPRHLQTPEEAQEELERLRGQANDN